MGPEEKFPFLIWGKIQIESVLEIPSRVILGSIEGFKIVILRLNLGSLFYFESHSPKDLHDLFLYPDKGMFMTDGYFFPREGDIKELFTFLLLFSFLHHIRPLFQKGKKTDF